MEKYYIAEFILNDTTYYMFWQDECFLTEGDEPVIFRSVEETKSFIAGNDLEVDDSATVYDLDSVTALITKTELSENCNAILDCWNIFSDIARTTETDFIGDHDIGENEDLYSKLVMGCNLPELENEDFHPVLDETEQKHLETVLNAGISIFRKITANI